MAVTLYWSNYTQISDFEDMDLTQGCGKTYKYFKYNVLYPFGWGISYTTFFLQWSNITSNCNVPNQLLYCISITNTGMLQGTETIFVFVIPPNNIPSSESVSHMKKHLVDWTKVDLKSQ